MIKKTNIVMVIPAYNEEATIGKVVNDVKKYVKNVVVVDDGSDDKTTEVAKKNGAVVVRKSKNEGYDKALNSGFKAAAKINPDIIITFDADAQHDSKDIKKVVTPIIENKADVVVGIRSFKQRVTEFLFAFYSKKKIGISDPLSGVKAYKIKVYKDIGNFDTIGSTGTELMFRANSKGFRLTEVPIHFYKRKDIPRFGRSVVGNFKILCSFLRVFVSVK